MIKSIESIEMRWPAMDPFIFGAHHLDFYPAGNERFGVDATAFAGRNMGSDFVVRDGYRLYHGNDIPGFPVHPHRGFETITIVTQGYVDHADSLGAAGRYGIGDVQWMTAGEGVQHSEMFPLLNKDKPNTLEIFQIWINLPSKNKMVAPDFKMLWANTIPKIINSDFVVNLVSGEFQGIKNYKAPENSWAADPENKVGVIVVNLKGKGEFKYPSIPGLNRGIYFYEGGHANLNGTHIDPQSAVFIDSEDEIIIRAEDNISFVILEGRPINEPVVSYGPFVMNTQQEIIKTIADYQQTEFGGWSWDRKDMFHGSKIERFAKYPDGRIERPEE